MAFEDDVILPSKGDNIIRTKQPKLRENSCGLAHELYTSMKKHKDKVGQIDAETGKEETFGVILERAVRVACHLRKLGVTPEDIVTPCTTNHLNTSVIFHAILFTGAKVASMDPFAPNEDMIRQLELVKPKLLFAIPENVQVLEKMVEKLRLSTKIVVFDRTERHTPFDHFLIPLPEEEKRFNPHIVKDVSETAFIVFSSGTTGSPKGICVHHRAAMGVLNDGLAASQQEQIYLSYASLVWASAIVTTIISTIDGHVKIMASGFEVEKAWKHLERYRVTFCFLAPQDVISMIKAEKPEGLELPHLKCLCPAGGALSGAAVMALRKMLPATFINTGYTQTEHWYVCLMPSPTPERKAEYLSKPGSCGRPTKGPIYKIVDPETGRTLGPNQPGELRLKSEWVMKGYYKANSEDRFDEEGFLKTGDIMYYDEEYWFFFVERLKEMLRYKMTAIAPTELESILVEHPSVKLAVVVGIPTDEGDLATAVVVKKDDNVTAEELKSLVAGRVDDRKKLRGGVKFVDETEIPRTPSGKIRRRALREYILKKL